MDMAIGGEKVTITIVVITVTAILIAMLGPVVIDGLENMNSEMESNTDTITETYTNEDITLWYDNDTKTSDVFNFTDLQNNGSELTSHIEIELFTIDPDNQTTLYINGSAIFSLTGTGTINNNHTDPAGFNYVVHNITVDHVESHGNNTYETHISNADMTVNYDKTYHEAAVKIAGLLPLIFVVGLLAALVVIVTKVTGTI